MEVPVDQITGRPDPLVPEGGAGALAPADTGNAGRFHQPLDPLAADPDAFIDQLGVDARRARAMGRSRCARRPRPLTWWQWRTWHGYRRHQFVDRDGIASL
jgi:hypothetical protein